MKKLIIAIHGYRISDKNNMYILNIYTIYYSLYKHYIIN